MKLIFVKYYVEMIIWTGTYAGRTAYCARLHFLYCKRGLKLHKADIF